MKLYEAYKSCPCCSEKLSHKGGNLLVCSGCNFNLYVNPSPCCDVIIEDERGQIMLVKRKDPPKQGWWDIPGGFMVPDEDAQTSAKREIKEELDVDIEVNEIIGAYPERYEHNNIEIPLLVIFVNAKITQGTIKVGDDVSDYKYFSKEEILDQRIGFNSTKMALRDYLKNTK